MSIAKFAVKNSVLVNMITIIVFLVGFLTINTIPKEEMPAVDFGSFVIFVVYPGVSTSEMEQLVLKPIEDEIEDVDNIDNIRSTASEGRVSVFVSFEPDADIDKAENDLRSELDKVNDLPTDAEDPVMIRLNMREVNEICDISLGGPFSGNAIREISEDLKQELKDVEYISNIEIHGTRDREIWVEADNNKLSQYGLTLNDLQSLISSRNMNVPGGTVDFGKSEFIVRTMGEFDHTSQIGDLVVRVDDASGAIRVKDVATVTDTLKEQDVITKLDMNPSVSLLLYKKAQGNIISVMKHVREKVDEFKKGIPGLKAEVRNDSSIEVNNSIRTLGSSAAFGIIMVFLVLLLFVGWRSSLLVSFGIPFSFFLTIYLLDQLGMTLNNLSLFGLVLVLGMIVDDAIVVLENVQRHLEEGDDPETASIRGTNEVMWPVVAAVATTVAAFLPMLIMQGMMGKFMRVFPVVVALALAASLFECLVILPSHIADFVKPINKSKKRKKSTGLHRWLVAKYRKVIIWALGHRVITVSLVIIALLLSVSAVMFRLVKFEFFPRRDSTTILLKLQTPVGTNLDQTNAIVSQVEKYILNFKYKEDINAVVTMVGQTTQNHRWNTGSQYGDLRIDLAETEDRTYSSNEIKDDIRAFCHDLPGLYSYKFDIPQNGPPTGNDIELRVSGDNLQRLEYIGQSIKDILVTIPGVTDVEDSFEEGKKEVRLVPIKDKLAWYNLSVAQVAGVVRTASYGTTVSKYRGGDLDEYDIILKVKENQINTLADLQKLQIRNTQGQLVNLEDVVDFEVTSGLSTISHRDSKRVITITGSNSFYTDSNGITRKQTTDNVMVALTGNKLTGTKGVLSDFEQRYPGYQLEFGGVAEEQKKSYDSLYRAFFIAVLIIYSILAMQFKSYVQPFVVMLTIPFSLIGVIFGLLVSNLPFSLNSLVAVVALTGVVVNDSLVLVDFVNGERERGVDRWNSLINAGAIRLRPIILTTLTTIIGLMPMILSPSKAAADWKGMAVAIAYGLGFATVLTLVVIPVIYSFIDQIFHRVGRFNNSNHKRISYKDAIVLSEKYAHLFAEGDARAVIEVEDQQNK